ncbi:hypothetical protein C7460_104281 [Marinoscillum furvescens DSM 4134]|uniref:Uncharacterized protein n=2 Tax=Marinoscillum furvescens TaxID=1026 RepID=A0A3D9L816_MARFU|nr:hypothetical protein C7460_104281 [Marinoscillum furvescens DSM 4134]
MIFREELRKAKLEQERIRKEYEQKISALTDELSLLREKLSSQEQMMKSAFEYAADLEERMKNFQNEIEDNHERNKYGYH